jgi:hypothetical protein
MTLAVRSGLAFSIELRILETFSFFLELPKNNNKPRLKLPVAIFTFRSKQT